MTPERIERQQKYLKEVYEQCTGIEAALPLKIIIVFQAYVEKKLGWKPVSYSTVIL